MDMTKILKVFGAAGIGGLFLFVFWQLYAQIIEKDIFSKLTKLQSYTIFVLLIVLIAVIVLLGLWMYRNTSKSSESSEDEVETKFKKNKISGDVHTGIGDMGKTTRAPRKSSGSKKIKTEISESDISGHVHTGIGDVNNTPNSKD